MAWLLGVMALLGAGAARGVGADPADQAVLDAAQRRIETLRKGDFTIKLVDETGEPVEGRAQVRLARHTFAFAADLGGLVERSGADPAAARALLWVEELFDAVVAPSPTAPAALWARDREKARLEEKACVRIEAAGGAGALRRLDERLDRLAATTSAPLAVRVSGLADMVPVATLCFSKPFLNGLVLGGVVDSGEAGGLGLIDKNGEKKPAYEVLRGLIKETWSTEWRGRIAGGRLAFRGFYGTYAVEVDGYLGTTFSCNSAAERAVTAVMVKHNGE